MDSGIEVQCRKYIGKMWEKFKETVKNQTTYWNQLWYVIVSYNIGLCYNIGNVAIIRVKVQNDLIKELKQGQCQLTQNNSWKAQL